MAGWSERQLRERHVWVDTFPSFSRCLTPGNQETSLSPFTPPTKMLCSSLSNSFNLYRRS